MNDWLPHQKTFLFEILAMEAPPADMICTSCLVQKAEIRCLDCLGSPILCRRCGLKNHHSDPYHKVEVWNGECFIPSDLHDVGLLIYLGHGGDRCPAHHAQRLAPQAAVPLQVNVNADLLHAGTDDEAEWNDEDIEEDIITAVHTTGVYKRRVQWCQCPQAAPRHIQLLQMRLYPASVKRPQTAFTFAVLDYFYLDAMECKTSANNFFNKLRRLTSNAFPHVVAVSSMTCSESLSFIHALPCLSESIPRITACLTAVASPAPQETIWVWTFKRSGTRPRRPSIVLPCLSPTWY
jgi:CxC2 like cysteine cluster associated with KDZ transposases